MSTYPFNVIREHMGRTVTDKVTKARGVVTSVSFDISGCVMCFLQPPVDKEGKRPDGQWLDLDRLIMAPGMAVMPTPNYGAAKGPADKRSPERRF